MRIVVVTNIKHDHGNVDDIIILLNLKTANAFHLKGNLCVLYFTKGVYLKIAIGQCVAFVLFIVVRGFNSVPVIALECFALNEKNRKMCVIIIYCSLFCPAVRYR